MLRRTWVVTVFVLSAALGVAVPNAASAKVQLPHRMAAVGDSITTATDVGWCCVNPSGGNPQYSWSTGTDPAVYSHYQRLAAEPGRATASALNAAVPGADSSDLAGQLGQAAAYGADYVTVLIGGNDVCWNPTPVDVFRQRVQSAFAGYFAAA